MDTSICPDGMDAAALDVEQLLALRTQELQNALNSARALSDQAPCGLLTFDAAQRCVHVNRTLTNWLGRTEPPQFMHELVAPAWQDALQSYLDARRPLVH